MDVHRHCSYHVFPGLGVVEASSQSESTEEKARSALVALALLEPSGAGGQLRRSEKGPRKVNGIHASTGPTTRLDSWNFGGGNSQYQLLGPGCWCEMLSRRLSVRAEVIPNFLKDEEIQLPGCGFISEGLPTTVTSLTLFSRCHVKPLLKEVFTIKSSLVFKNAN